MIWNVWTTGSDTVCSGGFDPSQTAGMNTDGAATVANTSAPVFSSASYNFVAGDVGASVYIASGTNWTPGWYKIASVASNKATLTGTIGGATLANSTPTTVVGCATTASPTGATWTIDYSQQAAAQFSYTDIVIGGTNTTATSAGHPFGKQQVGNVLRITSGTNFTVGYYTLQSVSGTTGTFNAALGTASSTGGHGNLGGALASPGLCASKYNSRDTMFVKAGTYNISGTSTNVSGGPISVSPNQASVIEGFTSIYGDGGLTSVATLNWTANPGSQTYSIVGGNGLLTVNNIAVAGGSYANPCGFSGCVVNNCKVANGAIGVGGQYTLFSNILIDTCTTGIAQGASGSKAIVKDCTNGVCLNGFNVCAMFDHVYCIGNHQSGSQIGFYNNFNSSGNGMVSNSAAIGMGEYGVYLQGFAAGVSFFNCLFYDNASNDFSLANQDQANFFRCAYVNAPSVRINNGGVTIGSNPFTTYVAATGSAGAGSATTGLNYALAAGATTLKSLLQTWLFSSTTSYDDVGPSRHQDPASGGGGNQQNGLLGIR